jgi:hypothetical protein
LQRLCFGPDVAAAYVDRGENRDPGKATATKTVDIEGAIRERSLERKGFLLDLAFGTSALMCPAFDAVHV